MLNGLWRIAFAINSLIVPISPSQGDFYVACGKERATTGSYIKIFKMVIFHLLVQKILLILVLSSTYICNIIYILNIFPWSYFAKLIVSTLWTKCKSWLISSEIKYRGWLSKWPFLLHILSIPVEALDFIQYNKNKISSSPLILWFVFHSYLSFQLSNIETALLWDIINEYIIFSVLDINSNCCVWLRCWNHIVCFFSSAKTSYNSRNKNSINGWRPGQFWQ